jgi:hypothetical protein
MPTPDLIALIMACVFTGTGLHISLSERPARAMMADRPMLACWRATFRRVMWLQSILALLGGIAGIVAWRLHGDDLWLLGAAALLANCPYSLVAVLPMSRPLRGAAIAEAGPETTRRIRRLGRLHHLRPALGFAAVLLYAFALHG